MVKKAFLITLSALFLLSLTSAVFLVAGEFTASVSSAQVQLGESVSLNLTLKDASPTEAPAVAVLRHHFSINSQQQLTNTTILNGKFSSNITWRLSLTPKLEGSIQIPAITVETEEGPLVTQPITLQVTKGAHLQATNEATGLNIITQVSNSSPYKNEPLIYTALLVSKMPLYNVKTQKIQVKDAIVELLGEPKIERRLIEGVALNVVEFNYLVTPLKTGELTIAPIAIQGAIPQAQRGRGQFSPFSNEDFDPFGNMPGFGRLKPFNLLTREVELDVQPPVAAVSPWLPAKALSVEEQWPSEQSLRVGEPFSRSFVIKADGLKASQLPHLDELQSQATTFKVYADKPEEQENVAEGSIYSIRKEQYTLIPQQAGTWELPEISVSWWDTATKQKRSAFVPARTVTILPALETAMVDFSESAASANPAATSEEGKSATVSVQLLYGITGMLTFCLIAALLWGFTLHRKIASLTKDMAPKPLKPVEPPVVKAKSAQPVPVVQKVKKETLPDLNPT